MAAGYRNGFKKAVTKLQTPVKYGYLVPGFTVYQRSNQSLNSRNASVPLVPPKPKEFDNATSIGISRAVCGT